MISPPAIRIALMLIPKNSSINGPAKKKDIRISMKYMEVCKAVLLRSALENSGVMASQTGTAPNGLTTENKEANMEMNKSIGLDLRVQIE